MNKHVWVIESFRDNDTLRSIYRNGLKNLSVVIRPDSDDILFMETPTTRIIAADNWQPSKHTYWTRKELLAFMDHNGPEFAYHTPSAFALSLFKTMHKEPFEMTLDGFKQRLCYDSVYGGRCEVVRFGTFSTHEYDINSSYPYAAVTQMFPDPRKLRYSAGEVKNIWRYEGVSTVQFSQKGWLPILPVHANGRIYYCETDRAVGTYTHTELRYAIENGVKVHRIFHQYFAPGTLRPFDSYVKYCFKQRSETGDKIWKRIAVALFGRLSVRPGQLLRVKPALARSDFDNVPEECQRKYGIWFVGEYYAAQRDSNPLWSSMVLSKARNRLHGIAFDSVRYAKSNTTYMDTDCIFRTKPADNLPVSDKLGSFKHQHGTYEIKGAKLYKTDRAGTVELVMKGVSERWRNGAAFSRARMTQERYKYDDGSTRPFTYNEGIIE